MIYKVIYIGKDKGYISHFKQIVDGGMMIVPNTKRISKLSVSRGVVTLFLFESTSDIQNDLEDLSLLKRHQNDYVVMISSKDIPEEFRPSFLSYGVNNLVFPDISKENFDKIVKLLPTQWKQSYSDEYKATRFKIPFAKRLFDIVASSLALIVLSPLLIVVSSAIWIEDKGPIIYKSKRIGCNYEIFDFLKFRSMYVNADQKIKQLQNLNQYATETDESIQEKDINDVNLDNISGLNDDDNFLISDDSVINEKDYLKHISVEQEKAFVKLENDPRVTKVGRFIRKYSIDELPQLINILKGNMSVVGNRPLPLYEAEKLTSDEYIARFMCPAGLTGLWQVEKRGNSGALSPEERKQLDIEYVNKMSLWLDFKIILRTFRAFIQKEDV